MSTLFGSVFQNGYVVRDLAAAVRHWTEVLGVGPFFLIDRIPIPSFRYRGEPSAAVVSVALAFSGDLEIELIEPHGDAPSMYRDFFAAGREGLHHLGYLVADFDDTVARARAAGLVIGQEGRGLSSGSRFVYFDTETHPGSVVELIEASESTRPFHEMIRQAARHWDGSEPLRPITLPVPA